MILCFFSSFCTSAHCKEVYERLCRAEEIPGFCKTVDQYYRSKHPRRLYITIPEEGIRPTHAICLNSPPAPHLLQGIHRDNILGLAFEPPVFLGITPGWIYDVDRRMGRYLIGEKAPDWPLSFVSHFAFLWHTPVPSLPLPDKTALISLMISEKRQAPGHRLRHILAQHILKTPGLPVDIYGRGCMFYRNLARNDRRLKGEFQGKEPFLNYRFHIAIENYSFSDYFSEKVIDPLLCETTPLYWGCKNIETYFPNSVHVFTGPEDGRMLLDAVVRDPVQYVQPIDVSAVARKINLLENVHQLFAGEENADV